MLLSAKKSVDAAAVGVLSLLSCSVNPQRLHSSGVAGTKPQRLRQAVPVSIDHMLVSLPKERGCHLLSMLCDLLNFTL